MQSVANLDHDMILGALGGLIKGLEHALQNTRLICAEMIESAITTGDNTQQNDEPLSSLRRVLSQVRGVQVNVCSALAETVANIAEQSNNHVKIARLPREMMAEVFGQLIYTDYRSTLQHGETDTADSKSYYHPLMSKILLT
ncbi:hypothetical protein SISSUDRAFT_481943 [Sistotremastrum suecicum HHB10207 ss-3]|uniref:Uncharacterized protein n=1 Tax=Sistotremastrum suecicum HHB10207 ss-3 TaxID=1314776 RepID=A0A166FBX7_9AGAM|nr:hypothetical protein SISSUDRAFT_481943 [Sistotremastrum suecicum HHB10207 ss-3]